MPAAPAPPVAAMRLGPWGATLLLSACFAFSYVDRQVLSLLVKPIKQSLGVSDSLIGLLQGISFSLFYVAASLPLARLADRGNRPRIAAACIAVWSIMSMACGLAASFWQLLLARIGLAVSEAGLPPAALTLMADMHDRRGLARATSLFMLAPFVGGGIALMAGGALYTMLDARPDLGGLEAWQQLFILAGMPGLVLAPLVALLLSEPRPAGRRSGGSLDELRGFMLGNWRFCVVYIVAIALIVTVLNAHIAWVPAAILRSFPLTEARMGAQFGIAYLVAGSAGTLFAGWLVGRAAGADMLGSTLRYMRLGAALLVLPAIVGPFGPSPVLMIGLIAIAVLFTSAVVSMGSIPFQIVAPPALRAQAIALSGLAAALLGTGLGPLLVGVASDTAAAAGAPHPLPVALAIVGGGAAAAAALLLSYALRHAGALPHPQEATRSGRP